MVSCAPDVEGEVGEVAHVVLHGEDLRRGHSHKLIAHFGELVICWYASVLNPLDKTDRRRITKEKVGSNTSCDGNRLC
jgi:hypothetical protein